MGHLKMVTGLFPYQITVILANKCKISFGIVDLGVGRVRPVSLWVLVFIRKNKAARQRLN